MRHLLNVLFVSTESAYATLDGENVVIKNEGETLGRYPLHGLEGICLFTYAGASPALMGACVEKNINLAFCTPTGRFLARATGEANGNVLLRKKQYRISDDPALSTLAARNLIFGKVANGRKSIERMLRDHGMRIDKDKFTTASLEMRGMMDQILTAENMEQLRGLEGASSIIYFRCLDDMILRDKEHFYFRSRTRRPPLDRVNAMLSFAYSLLGNDCASALETVGLDSYVGFMHRDRPGRNSLALDLMEELRYCYADRFVLTLINNQVITAKDFSVQESGAVLLTDQARRAFLKQWQERKKEVILHPYLEEKIPWGLVPYAQALLMARYIRGDIDEYPPYLWR